MARNTLRTLIGATLLAAAGLAQADEQKTVAITQIVEHPALDAVYQGVRDELAEEGYKDGENLRIMHESAQGNAAIASQIARKFVGGLRIARSSTDWRVVGRRSGTGGRRTHTLARRVDGDGLQASLV